MLRFVPNSEINTRADEWRRCCRDRASWPTRCCCSRSAPTKKEKERENKPTEEEQKARQAAEIKEAAERKRQEEQQRKRTAVLISSGPVLQVSTPWEQLVTTSPVSTSEGWSFLGSGASLPQPAPAEEATTTALTVKQHQPATQQSSLFRTDQPSGFWNQQWQ